MLGQPLSQLRLGHGTCEFGNDVPIPEQLYGGNPLNVESLGQRLVYVDVDLYETDGPLGVFRDPLDDGPEHAARSAPWCPEIDEYGLIVAFLNDFLFETIHDQFVLVG